MSVLFLFGIFSILKGGWTRGNIGLAAMTAFVGGIAGYFLFRAIKNSLGYLVVIHDGILRYKDISFGKYEQFDLRTVVHTEPFSHWHVDAKLVFFRHKMLRVDTGSGRKHFITLTFLWDKKLLFREIDKYSKTSPFDYSRLQANK